MNGRECGSVATAVMSGPAMFPLPLAMLLCVTSLTAALPVTGYGGLHRLGMQVVSSRPGHLFTDSDPLDVRVQLSGATGVVVVAYTIEESGGPWKTAGRIEVLAEADGRGEGLLPLQLLGRGLYHLKLTARGGGGESATAETWIAVVFTPAPPSPDSPWGIFYTPHLSFDRDNSQGPRWAAVQHRLLGASWSRLNFWAHSFEQITVAEGDRPTVAAEYPMWREYVRALREEGIYILGEISQCPRELSSRPDDEQTVGDAGPVYSRVKPRDYRLWDSLLEQLAADFCGDIQVWEVWNEANLENRYWTGTAQDFAELVAHTSGALRRGNPNVLIAAAGFVDGYDFADKLLTLGMGQHIDILSVHYTDETPGDIARWRTLLDEHQLSLPIWNSEESSEVPIRNIAGGIERSFKFLHVDIGYPNYRPLVRDDWTVTPAGMLFSVGAHCLGSGKFAAYSDKVEGYDVLLFRRGAEIVGVFDPAKKTGVVRLFGPRARRVTVVAEPVDPEQAGTDTEESGPRVTDAWGRTSPLAIERGRATISLTGGMLFVNGCRRLEVLSADMEAGSSAELAVEAESGRFSGGWQVATKEGFSAGRVLEIWTRDEPDQDGYWVELRLVVPVAGTYEVLFSGNSLARLQPPRSLSPFTWSMDGGAVHAVQQALPVVAGVSGAVDGLSVLGTVELSPGEHTFQLRLSGPRDEPDTCYALWFDAIGVRLAAAAK